MPVFQKHPPQALFQVAVAIGCVALLIGGAGVVYYGHIDPAPPPPLPVGDAALILEGVADPGSLLVEAAWDAPRGGTFTETGRPTGRAGSWRFRLAPAARPLRLRIYRRTPHGLLILHEQPGVFARGAGFVIQMPAATAPPVVTK